MLSSFFVLFIGRVVTFQEYIDSVKQQQQRVADLEQAMHEALADWTLAPVVEGLMALHS